MDPKTAVDVLRRRWRIVAAFIVAGLALAVLVAFSTTPKYQSTQTIYVSAQDPAGDPARAYQGSLLSAQRIKSYVELADEADVLDSAGLALGRSISADQVSVTAESNTVLMQVSFRDTTADAAQSGAGAVSDALVNLIGTLEQPTRPNLQSTISARRVGQPSVPLQPYSPNWSLTVLLGLVVGAAAGVAGATVRHYFDTTVRNQHDAEQAVGSVQIGELPVDEGLAHNGGREQLQSITHEKIRQIRTNLSFVGVDSACKVVLVTSARPSEGKTTLAANLARSLSSAGHSVLLVDCDLRLASVASNFNLEPAVGLSTVLAGRARLEEALQKDASGVYVLVAGPKPPNPAELLGSHQMQELLANLGHFEYVLLDAPPVLPVADASILAAYADGILLVVRQNSTKTTDLVKVVSQARILGTRIFGFVLTLTRPAEDKSGYSYYGAVPSRSSNADIHGEGETGELRINPMQYPKPRPRPSSSRRGQ